MSAGAYHPGFFDAIEPSSRHSALHVVPVAARTWRPRHVVDVGCGQGVWAAVFEALDVPVLGIDGAHVAPEQRLIARFLAWDLARPLPDLGRFDLCVCLEVAEHLDAAVADQFVASLAALSDRVLFSAAVPGQGGTGHVNEQPHDYWIERFDRQGFAADVEWRCQFGDVEQVAWWYRRNMIVFERREPRPESPPHLAMPAPEHRGLPPAPRCPPRCRHGLRGSPSEPEAPAPGGPGALVRAAARRVVARWRGRRAGRPAGHGAATTGELAARLDAVETGLAALAGELADVRVALGEAGDLRDVSVANRLAALEYAVRRIHGPLLLDRDRRS